MRRLALLLLCLAACPKGTTADAGASPDLAPTQDWLDGVLPHPSSPALPIKGGTFTVRVAVEPAGLNRVHDQQAEGTMSRYTRATVYETLAELDRDTHPRYDLKPLLAQSWEESDDHLTLTVHLRRAFTFTTARPSRAAT